MEWGTPVKWGRFLLFCVPQSVKTKETNPTRPGSPTPCKQALKSYLDCILRSGVIFSFASLFLWLEREKNNAWYIHLTSRQPHPNLHNLTSARPVMLLANKRLPYGNQILARIMSFLKSILGKRKFLSTSVFRRRFLKKVLNALFLWWNTASWSCRTFI